MTRGAHTALASLCALHVSAHTGPDWALDDVTEALHDTGRAIVPLHHPAVVATLRRAAHRFAERVAGAVPAGLELIADQVWGPSDTDLNRLRLDAVTWRERAAFAEIVAQTGLWRPPPRSLVPHVRLEGRVDEITPDGRRISQLANRADAGYWSVYGVHTDGRLELAADFAHEPTALRHAARWLRPGVLIYADYTAPLPAPGSSGVPVAPMSSWQPPRPAGRSDPVQRACAGLRATGP